MTQQTIHGMKPAIDFLSYNLAKDSGKVVTLGCRRSRSRLSEYEYWFRFHGESRLISFGAPGWKWKDPEYRPEMFDWSAYACNLRPFIVYYRSTLVERLMLDFVGIETVPGLTIEKGSPHANAVFFDTGYLLGGSPVWLEYRRRFTLEAAELLQKQAVERIRKNLALVPFMQDEQIKDELSAT